uniref:Uncharacterized protein n=1 Tax=Arundo donax TaxID=35708 RepID=A0A0A9DWQ9_ARUDO
MVIYANNTKVTRKYECALSMHINFCFAFLKSFFRKKPNFPSGNRTFFKIQYDDIYTEMFPPLLLEFLSETHAYILYIQLNIGVP